MWGIYPPVRRALTGFIAVLLGTGALLASTAPSAAADPGPIGQRSPTSVTADALPTVQINGVAWDQVVAGETVYVGGNFSSARPAGSPAGSNETPRSNLLAYNIRTGALITSFAPTVNGQIKALALSPDKTRLYIAGTFTQVNGQNRYRVASFTIANGALTSFQPSPNTTVNSIAVTDSAVYAAGSFSKVGAVDRSRLAAFNPTTGALLGWAPAADATVNSILPTPDGSKIIVAGAFANLNGTTAQGLGAIDAVNAATLPWTANTVVRNYGTTAAMLKLRTDGETIYAVGYWFGGTGNFEGVLAAEPNSGAVKWLADCHGDTYDVAAMADQVYAMSHWHHCQNIGGYPDTNPRNAWYYANAMTKTTSGTVAHNNQGGYYDFFGYGAPAMINWFPTLTAGTFTGQSQAAWSATSTNEYLLLGGEFPSVNGTSQQGLVRFAVPSLAPKKQGPRVAGAAFNPSLVAVRPTEVRIKWQANHDRDDNTLTYELTRVGTVTPIYTTTASSQFWNRPSMGAADTGLTPGQTYRYRLLAKDPDGNLAQSEIVSITMPTSVDPYVSAVLDDNASNYWRLNSSGTTQVDYAGSLNQTNTGTTTAAGAVAGDSALGFPGTASGQSGTSSPITGPNTFSAESWFRTSTTSGGKILGFGGSATGVSSSYDRHVYMDDSGRLTFGVYPGAVRTIRSPKSYNDNQWHHVVATLSSGGMQLYVDGLRVAANTSVTSAEGYSGFWRIGGDNLAAWTDRPSSDFFNGTIDETAIYPAALSAAQIRDHYTKSGRTSPVPPAPADSYGKAVYNDDPELYWRMNEAAGPTASDSGPSLSDGTYRGGVSYRAAGPASDPAYAADFNGIDGFVSSNNSYSNPMNYSTEVWFKTTSTSGGKLIGFGCAQEGLSGCYDRHTYMDNSGRVTFGVWTGFTNTITTDNSLNDGKWHHVVATQSSTDGMKLFVDGKLNGTNGQTSAQDYSGHWRVGGDNHWGCCTPFLAGTIDEAAVYSKVLTAAQVKAHYDASPAAVNEEPRAAFTSSCTENGCQFDSSESTDPDGTIASYAWDFGDGDSSSAADPKHAYTESGTYTVKLTVTDNKGATNQVSKSVIVTVIPPNVDPVANFSFACDVWSCAFDSSSSSDPDGGTITAYAWNFGDGGTSTQANPTHAYAGNGTFNVTLKITDDRGGTHTASKSVTVRKNVAPIAAFEYDCDALACTFDSAASSDSDGTIELRGWDFGDGGVSTAANPSHTFDAPGEYQVKLTVTDDDGATHSTTETTVVNMAPPNVDPVAQFVANCTDLSCSFNAGTSADEDGTIASYRWDFDDNTAAGSGETTTHTYASAGGYDVTLTVTDNDGGTNSVTKTVTATAPPAGPIAQDNFNRTVTRWGTAQVGGTYTYAGSTFATNGSQGTIRLASAGVTATASLASVSARDVDVLTDLTIDKAATGGGVYNSVVVRRIGTSDYRLTMRAQSNGSAVLTLARTLNGTATTLRQVTLPGVTMAAGDTFRVRFTANGNGTTTLSAKAWKVGTPEPAAAQVTATDNTAALQAPGSFQVVSYLSGSSTNAPVMVSVDNLLISAG